jgi:hypothetical protein
MNNKKVLLKIIKVGNVYIVIIIIREGLHVIKNDPVNDEYRKAEDKLARNSRQVIKAVKNQY